PAARNQFRRTGQRQAWASGREQHKPDDLNHSNRLVRTRMPGGVGGDRSDYLTAPIPIAVDGVLLPPCRRCSLGLSRVFIFESAAK
ncbi:hypothetical protein, partial [Burkholderia ubonensis]|uniref:hypothetical protein n=3 Tax=Burkholderia ubonensis TaxID=101571 RepID=UPI001E419365